MRKKLKIRFREQRSLNLKDMKVKVKHSLKENHELLQTKTRESRMNEIRKNEWTPISDEKKEENIDEILSYLSDFLQEHDIIILEDEDLNDIKHGKI